MIDSLSRTRPWVLFVGIILMVGCAFLVLAGGAMFAVGNLPGVADDMGPLAGASLGAAYLLMALLYFLPALHLLRYGIAIKRIGPANHAAMEDALDRQASFWRFVGIMTAVVILVYVAAIAIVAMLTAYRSAAGG